MVTGKARSKIKHYLKKQQKEESVELGRRLVEKALYAFGMPLEHIPKTVIDTIVENFQLDSPHHLFEEVGIGNRPALLVAKQMVKLMDDTTKKEVLEALSLHPLIIKGTEGLAITYADCCRPIPGDQIGGLIKMGQGIEVHLLNCPVPVALPPSTR